MDIFKTFLFIHIAVGTLGLLAGTYIAIAKKGNKIHKLIGKLFSISMLGAGISSCILATIHKNNFLFAVGIFTIYMVCTGWRYLYLKNIINGQKAKIIDWIIMVFMVFGCIAFLVMGIQSLIHKEYFGTIILVFAWRGVSFIIQDFKTYTGEIVVKNYWLIFHLQRMLGAYIASLTAFAAVNASNRFFFLPWLLPTILIVPFIIKWTKKHRIV